MFTLNGTVHEVGDTQQITDKFKKRTLVVFVENEKKPEYSDYIPIDAVQDNVDKLDPLRVGDTIEVNFFLGGRKWEKDGKTRYFPDLKLASVNVTGGSQQAPTNNAAPAPENDYPEVEGDDLPF